MSLDSAWYNLIEWLTAVPPGTNVRANDILGKMDEMAMLGPETQHEEPMSGLPADAQIEQAKRNLQAAIRGDDAWRHPDVYPEDEPVNMAAPMPEIYKHAHAFMSGVFGEDSYTPDSVGQLVEVFVPCLRIMVERGYEPTGGLWRKAGVLGIIWDVRKKFERLWFRTWTQGKRHDDSGFDLINFTGMLLRADPDSRFGDAGEPAGPEQEDGS